MLSYWTIIFNNKQISCTGISPKMKCKNKILVCDVTKNKSTKLKKL